MHQTHFGHVQGKLPTYSIISLIPNTVSLTSIISVQIFVILILSLVDSFENLLRFSFIVLLISMSILLM